MQVVKTYVVVCDIGEFSLELAASGSDDLFPLGDAMLWVAKLGAYGEDIDILLARDAGHAYDELGVHFEPSVRAFDIAAPGVGAIGFANVDDRLEEHFKTGGFCSGDRLNEFIDVRKVRRISPVQAPLLDVEWELDYVRICIAHAVQSGR